MNINDLPKSIKVGPYNFKVFGRSKSWYNTHGVFGNMVSDILEINICSVFMPVVVLDTLIHEINHAIWYVYHIEDKDDEERIVSIMSTAWVAVLRDNPVFVEFQNKILSDYNAKGTGE